MFRNKKSILSKYSANWLILLLLMFGNNIGVFGQSAVKGVLDIRNIDFSKKQNLTLDGEWLFYPSELVSVGEDNDLTPRQIKVPSLWGDSGLRSLGFGTYQLTVIKSAGSEPLMIKVPDIFSAYKFFANGRLLTEVGVVADNPVDYSPGRRVRYVSLAHLTSDTLLFHIQVANWTHSKAGLEASIEIASLSEIIRRKTLNDSYDMFLAGCLVLGCFFFLGLYFHGRQEQTALYFALFCVAYGYRVVGWGNYLLNDLFDIPYQLGIRLEYATLYLCGYFFSKYILLLFPEDSPKLLVKIFSTICLIWTGFTLFPIDVLSQLNIYFVYSMLFGLGLGCFIFVKSILNKRTGYNFTIFITVGILLIFVMKTLSFLGVIEEIRALTAIGEVLFFFLQSLMLSKLFSASWREAKNEAEQIVRAKSDFLSVMSHEIRTPLNAVIGTTYHLLEDNPREDQLRDFENLRNSSDNLLTLVNNLLDFSKIDMGKLELEEIEVKLRDYCNAQLMVFESTAEKKNITLTFEYDSRLPRLVMMDKTRISQILVNLIGNAMKFTESGGITLRVSEIKSGRDGVLVEFAIEDTGIGIEPDKIERIFESFEQANTTISRKYGGTGLGLAITKKLLDIMGSPIKVTSEVGKGSVFSFQLMLEPVVFVVEKEAEPPKDLSGIKVLLVEDNMMNVMIAKRFLEKWKLEVDTAENGIVAVTKGQEKDYDLILMDLQMPEMDGFEATRILRQKGFSNPIIALTAASSGEETLKVKRAGMDDFVSKPYDPNVLYTKIQKSLRRKPNPISG